MKNGVRIGLALLGLIFLSCQKDGLSSAERKALGEWEFVKVQRNGHNISNDFAGHFITFKADFTAQYRNEQIGTLSEGIWDLVENYSNDTYSNTIFSSFSDPASNELMQVVLGDASIGNKRMVGYFRDGTQEYRFVLEK